jgi:hypothetical protein
VGGTTHFAITARLLLRAALSVQSLLQGVQLRLLRYTDTISTNAECCSLQSPVAILSAPPADSQRCKYSGHYTEVHTVASMISPRAC